MVASAEPKRRCLDPCSLAVVLVGGLSFNETKTTYTEILLCFSTKKRLKCEEIFPEIDCFACIFAIQRKAQTQS